MTLLSNSFSFCVGLVLAVAAQAQAPDGVSETMVRQDVESYRATSLVQNTHSTARIEVMFSGSQSDRFIFDENAGAVFQHKGLAMRTVGMADIEMGARKTRVGVMREDAKPEMFHTHFDTAGGGTVNAVLALQVGEEKTVSLVGGKPTKVTVKRLR